MANQEQGSGPIQLRGGTNAAELFGGLVDAVQGLKNIVVTTTTGGVQDINKHFDALIDALQKAAGTEGK